MGGVTIGLGNGALHAKREDAENGEGGDEHGEEQAKVLGGQSEAVTEATTDVELVSGDQACRLDKDPSSEGAHHAAKAAKDHAKPLSELAPEEQVHLLERELQEASHAAQLAEDNARSLSKALRESREELERVEKLLRGRAQDVEHAEQAKQDAESKAMAAEARVASLHLQLQQERRESSRLAEQASELRSGQFRIAETESLQLKTELQEERSARRRLEAGKKTIEAKLEELQKRCSALEHAKKEAAELRTKLEAAIKAKANALAMTGKAVAEADHFRAMMKKAEDKQKAVTKHARALEGELDGERADLQRRAEEMERQHASLQDDLMAVQAAGVLSKSGTLRFEINGMTSPKRMSRPSTAASPSQPDDNYRLTKQVCELQDRLRWYQSQEHQQGEALNGRQSRIMSARGMHELNDQRSQGLLQMATAIGNGQGNVVYANRDAEAVDLRLQIQHERAAAAQREANLQAELDFIKSERSQAHKRADLHSRQMHELQIQLRAFQQAQEQPFLQKTRHEMDGLRGELSEARKALAQSQEWASEAQATISQKDDLIASLQLQMSANTQTLSAQAENVLRESRPMYIRRGRRDPGPALAYHSNPAIRPTTAPAPNTHQQGDQGSSIRTGAAVNRSASRHPTTDGSERAVQGASRPPTSPGVVRGKVSVAWKGTGDNNVTKNTPPAQGLRQAAASSAGPGRSSAKCTQLWRSRSLSSQNLRPTSQGTA